MMSVNLLSFAIVRGPRMYKGRISRCCCIHEAYAARYRSDSSALGSQGEQKPSTRRGLLRRRNYAPAQEDLPTILTAAAMVRLCGRPENWHAPLIGLDVAPTNFGVSISDNTRSVAIPLGVIHRRDAKTKKKLSSSSVFTSLRRVVEETSACGLVVGWPLSLSGRAESQCLMVLHFLRQMRLVGKVLLPVTLRDERMTTVEARGLMYNEGLDYKEVSAMENETAAMVILQGFLDCAEAEAGGLSTLSMPLPGPENP